jgi:hypothetical protein
MQVYLTTVWPVDHYQDEVTPAQQAAAAVGRGVIKGQS